MTIIESTNHSINPRNLSPPLLHSPRSNISTTLHTPHTILTPRIITLPPLHLPKSTYASPMHIPRPPSPNMIHRRRMSLLTQLPLKLLIETENRTLARWLFQIAGATPRPVLKARLELGEEVVMCEEIEAGPEASLPRVTELGTRWMLPAPPRPTGMKRLVEGWGSTIE